MVREFDEDWGRRSRIADGYQACLGCQHLCQHEVADVETPTTVPVTLSLSQ